MKVRVAAAQYDIGEPRDFDAFASRVGAQVAAAAKQGAHIVVLPEYLALEIAAMFDTATRGDFLRSLAALQAHHDAFLALMRELARTQAIHLAAGSFLFDVGGGHYRNRAYFVSPKGDVVHQDKLTLTGFERGARVIEAGDEIKVFETDFGRVAIDICYDVEFPLYARAQAEAGARLLLVPSCTDTAAGANRVLVGCRARALENPLYVACAVTAGDAPWSPALDVNTGTAGIYAPIDRGFPDDGIVARAEDEWAIADLDLGAFDANAQRAQVANARDWPSQLRPSVQRARVERL